MTLLNKTAVRKFILSQIEARRPGWKATRVSGEALENLEARLARTLLKAIDSHPTIGQTFTYKLEQV